MLVHIMSLKRILKKFSMIEKAVIALAITFTVLGFFYINHLFTGEGRLSWAILEAAFLWFILFFLLILTETNNKIKEELKEVINQHIKETKILQEMSGTQITELKGLRRDLTQKKKR